MKLQWYDLFVIPPIVKIYATWLAAGISAVLLMIAATGISNNFFLLRFGIMVFLCVLAINFFMLNYRQLALASLVAALVFNPYIYPHLPRQIWVILDIAILAGVLYAAYWATNPYKKGTRFEEYVVSLFPESEFALQDRTRDLTKHTGRFVESDTHPDLVFRALQSGRTFAVECKYRSRWGYQVNGGQGTWWNLYQFARYEEYQKRANIPVYVAFGIGGSPKKPNEVYFLELDRLRFPFLFRSLIKSGKTPAVFVQELA